MKNSIKISTFKDLKAFLDTLNEDQLAKPALLHIVDSEAETIETAYLSTEDEYLTDDGFVPVSMFEPEDWYDILENYDIRKAGHPYLLNE